MNFTIATVWPISFGNNISVFPGQHKNNTLSPSCLWKYLLPPPCNHWHLGRLSRHSSSVRVPSTSGISLQLKQLYSTVGRCDNGHNQSPKAIMRPLYAWLQIRAPEENAGANTQGTCHYKHRKGCGNASTWSRKWMVQLSHRV